MDDLKRKGGDTPGTWVLINSLPGSEGTSYDMTCSDLWHYFCYTLGKDTRKGSE